MAKKILYLSPSGTLLGARISLIELCRRLNRTRYEPVVAAPSGGDLLHELRDSGIPGYSADMRTWRKVKMFPRHPFTLWSLFHIVKRHNIELIHSNESWSNPFGVIISRLTGHPCICHIRSPIERGHIEKYYLNHAGLIISISRGVAESVTNSGQIKTPVKIVYNGVDLDRYNPAAGNHNVREEFSIPPGVPVVGSVGRICHRKAQDILLRAARLVLDRIPETRFLLVGPSYDTDYMETLHSLIRDLRLENHVLFTGNREDMVSVYASMDVLALTSRREGFGRVNIEAMAMEKPVLASNAEGIDEVIRDGETGFIVPVDDVEKTAETLIRLLENTELSRMMGTQGRRLAAQKFSIESHVETIESIYDEILKT